MAKRIYWESVKKWTIKAGIPAGITSFTLLFIYLSFLGVIEVTDYSGDMVCAGTEGDPCLAFINFTAKEDIFLYPIGYDPYGRDTPFETDKDLKSWKIYRSWGSGWREIKLNDTCTGTWCGAPDNKGVKYSFVFREGRDYQIRIVAHKKDPTEDIKWGFGPVDPVWIGVKQDKIHSRGATWDLHYLGDDKFKKTYYSGAVNAKLNDGTFIPFEEFVNISDDKGRLRVKDFYGRECYFELDYNLTNKLEVASPKIDIIRNRGNYYFTTDVGKRVDFMNFKLTDCNFNIDFVEDKLLLNDIKIDFAQAKDVQNLSTKLKKEIVYKEIFDEGVWINETSEENYKLEFSIIDGKTGSLSVIDPFVNYYNYSVNESIGEILEWSRQSSMNYPPVNLLPGGTYSDVTSDADFDSKDGSGESFAIYADQHGSHRFMFNISETNYESLISINWTITAEEGGDFERLDLWNYDTSSWDNYYDDVATSFADYSLYNQTDVSSYVNETDMRTYMIFACEESSASQSDCFTDFVKLEITYIGNYSLSIFDPTTASPVGVNDSSNITVQFEFLEDDDNVTSGVTINNITIGGLEASIMNSTTITGVWYIRTDDNGVSGADGLENVSYLNMPNTSYSALATPLTDDDVVYSLKFYNKATGDNMWWLEDDVGSNEIANFMYGVIGHGHFTGSSKHIECGSETGSASAVWAVTFDTNFPDTDYAAICNPITDSDSPICIQNDIEGKAVGGLEFRFNDDAGDAETLTGVDWCVFEHGEYDFGEVAVKAGSESVTNGAMSVSFTTDFPDTNYVVFITDGTSYSSDGCSCEVDARNVGSFAATCADDGGSTANCDETFDWVAIEKGDFNSTVTQFHEEFVYVTGVGWEVNITVPSGLTGLQDLFVNATDGFGYAWNTETNAVLYGVEDPIYPLFSNNVTSPASPITYSSGASYEFNITILNNNGSVEFEFEGVNYTATNISDQIFNYTLTDLAGGTFDYIWSAYGNGTSNNQNASLRSSYTISTASSELNLTINSTQGNYTADNRSSEVWVNATFVTGSGNITVYVDGILNFTGEASTTTAINSLINLTVNTSTYNVSAIFNGNSNYSASQDTWWVNLSEYVPPSSTIDLDLIYPLTNITVTQYALFNVTVNVTCRNVNCGEINVSLDPWWDSSWLRKKEINISENSGTDLYNYSVNLSITYDSDMSSNFEDLRFLNDVEDTELDYHIESYTSDTSAVVWVKVPSISASSSTVIYMYYKNSSAVSTTSNPNTTFIFYEDEFSDWEVTSGTFTQGGCLIPTDSYSRAYKNFTFAETMKGFALELELLGPNGAGEMISYTLLGNSSKTTCADASSDCFNWNGIQFKLDDEESGSQPINTVVINSSNGAFIRTAADVPGQVMFTGPRTSGLYNFTLYRNSTNYYNLTKAIGDYVTLLNYVNPMDYLSGKSFDKIEHIGRFGHANERLCFVKLRHWVENEPNYTIGSEEGNIKSGLVSTITGTIPFYTNDSNPINITLNQDESQTIIFWVNATGNANNNINHTFFVYVNQTSDMSTSNITGQWNVTIIPLVLADTCSCPGSGESWEVNMEDYCNLTSSCNLGAGNLSWIGSSGYFNCSAQLNLTNRDAPPSSTIFYHSLGCEVNRI